MSYLKIRPLAAIILSVLVLIATVLYMLTIGSAQLPLPTVVAVMVGKLFGIVYTPLTSAQEIIVWNIRWQRIALAVIIGGGLAVSGVCFQTMFKNPLADPFVLGVSSGAALGAALSIITQTPQLMIVFAFAGALISLALVYFFSQSSTKVRSDQQLLLAGIACGAMLNAMLSAIMALHSQQIQIIIFWLMGSLTNYVENLLPVFAIVALGLIIAMVYARDLDVMTLGDDDARFLGVNVDRVKGILLISTTLMTGACVAVSGIIGFIGLIIPHMVRKVVGTQHLLLLPLSAIWGALFLLLSDGLTRSFPLLSSIPVGVVTALFGGPFFLYILYSTGRRG
jgi:iron complex transport system permease protein